MSAAADALEAYLVDAIQRAVGEVVERSGPRAYSVQEVAARLGISDEGVRRLIIRGHLPTVPHLSPRRISAAALDAFLRGDT